MTIIDITNFDWPSSALDAVEKLQTENARLRAALSEIADGDAHHDGAAKFMEIARRALEK